MTKTKRLRQKDVTAFLRRNTALVYLVVLFTLCMIFIPNFRSLNNINSLIRQSAAPIIRTLAVSFILVLGNVDLSLGYTVGLTSVVLGYTLETGLPIWQCLLLGLAVGAAFGAFNGFFVAYMDVPSFIVTFGSGLLAYGIGNIFSRGEMYTNLPDSFLALVRTPFLGYPISVTYAVILVALVLLLFEKTKYGRGLISTGLNKKAAFLSGNRVPVLIFSSFLVAGVLASFTGVLLTGRSASGQMVLGGLDKYTFEGITACVLGGTSLSGGKINIMGCVFAAIIILILENILTIFQVNIYFFKPMLGLIVLFAVLIDRLKERSAN